jgi:N-acetylglucosaminyldiphosphoundecaprenol N-acetyl-beta-D-mannosaminyltransferase
VDDGRKGELLRHLLLQPPVGQALVFCKTKRGANRVGEALERSSILGVPIDLVDRSTALASLHRQVSSGHDGLYHLVTLNPEYVMQARRDARFCDILENANLVVCDGVGTLMAARAIGAQGPLERLTGVEIVELLAAWSAFADHGGLFFLGGRDAEAAAESLRRSVPSAPISGAWSGGTSDASDDSASLARITDSGATILLVAYGAPAQDFWIDRNRADLAKVGVRIAVGVGGAFDYLSGHATPAPDILRRAGLEWSWRLAHEPWRWKRQTALLRFAALTATESVRQRAAYRILGTASRRDNDRESTN